MITSFTGAHRFLSNFYPCAITAKGEIFNSVENAYQAMKMKSKKDFLAIKNMSPGQAKRYGRRMPWTKDWEKKKVAVMKRLLEEKFKCPHLRSWLLQTGTEKLVEGNNWGDKFWGVCNGVGRNRLGKLLMEVRKELRRKGEEDGKEG